MEKFIETKEDLQLVESELKDYENLTCLVNIIKTIFQTLANKIDLKLMWEEKIIYFELIDLGNMNRSRKQILVEA